MSHFKKHTERFPIAAKIAKELGRNLVFLDTETTGLLNFLPVGLVDLAIMVVNPNGEILVLDSLINPEIPIPEAASKVHGLYQNDLIGAPTFEEFISTIDNQFSSGVISGFNSKQYDVPVLLHNMDRYGYPGQKPFFQLDVRDLWTREEKKQKGKLTEIAELLGVEKGTAHRALGDVLTTARIFEAMVQARGIDWLKEISPETFGGQKYVNKLRETPEIKAIKESLNAGYKITPSRLAIIAKTKRLHYTALSFAVSNLLKNGEIGFEQCADPKCQEEILSVLNKALENLKPVDSEKHIRLRPLKESLDRLNGKNNDYIQIRVAMNSKEKNLSEQPTKMVQQCLWEEPTFR